MINLNKIVLSSILMISIGSFTTQESFSAEISQEKINESLGFVPQQSNYTNPNLSSYSSQNLLPPNNTGSNYNTNNAGLLNNNNMPFENSVVPQAQVKKTSFGQINNSNYNNKKGGFLSDYMSNFDTITSLEKKLKEEEILKKIHDLKSSGNKKIVQKTLIKWPTVVSYAVFKNKSWAVLQFPNGKSYYAQMGDTLPNHFFIKSIDKRGVILTKDKHSERLAMAPLVGVEKNNNSQFAAPPGAFTFPGPGGPPPPPMNPIRNIFNGN